MRLQIAFRNTVRNQRRTILNLFMIAGAVVAMILFKGFSDHMLYGLRESLIISSLGHIQLATPAFWDQTEENSKDALLTDTESVLRELEGAPGVKSVAARLTFHGLVSSGDRTASAQGLGFDPVREKAVIDNFIIKDGKRITGPDSSRVLQVMLGIGLANKMRVKAGDSVTILGHTFDGVINAIDTEVAGIFQNGIAELDNSTFILSLSSAQTLLDTTAAEKIVITLDSTDKTSAVLSELQSRFQSQGSRLRFRPWSELSKFYQEVTDYFNVFNAVIRAIILSLVLVGILNTIGMSILERTGEIGTIRSLGETELSVIIQFLVEGGILGFLGAASGMIAATLIAWLLNSLRIPVPIPGASLPMPVEIDLHFSTFRDAASIAALITLGATLIPAVRASRMNIVEALKRNI